VSRKSNRVHEGEAWEVQVNLERITVEVGWPYNRGGVVEIIFRVVWVLII
jgi:hypothetical protein